MIRIAFRFDDPSPTSDHVVEIRLIAELQRRRLCATFGTVPFSMCPEGRIALDRENAAHLLEARRCGVIEIAQHGHSHAHSPHHAPGRPSEFIGLDLAEQEALIREGRQHLSTLFETPIEGFVPPWNSGDSSTLMALKNLGFRYVSSAIHSFSGVPSPICRLPWSCHLNTMEQALEEALLYRQLSPVLILVMHPYDFNAAGCYGFEQLGRLLDRITSDQRLQVQTLGQIAADSQVKSSLHSIDHALNKHEAYWRLQPYYPQFCLIQRPLYRVLFSQIRSMGRFYRNKA